MSSTDKIKCLFNWCVNQTKNYKNVKITNFTTSWRNGLGFCAILHQYGPEFIEFDSLKPEDIHGNCQLAFEVGENCFGIPALLDAGDMVLLQVPDRLSIITYLFQFYSTLSSNKPKMNITVVSPLSPIENVSEYSGKEVNVNKSTESDVQVKQRSDPTCEICFQVIYLLEKLAVNGKSYHRSCYRQTQLSNLKKRNLTLERKNAIDDPTIEAANNSKQPRLKSPEIENPLPIKNDTSVDLIKSIPESNIKSNPGDKVIIQEGEAKKDIARSNIGVMLLRMKSSPTLPKTKMVLSPDKESGKSDVEMIEASITKDLILTTQGDLGSAMKGSDRPGDKSLAGRETELSNSDVIMNECARNKDIKLTSHGFNTTTSPVGEPRKGSVMSDKKEIKLSDKGLGHLTKDLSKIGVELKEDNGKKDDKFPSAGLDDTILPKDDTRKDCGRSDKNELMQGGKSLEQWMKEDDIKSRSPGLKTTMSYLVDSRKDTVRSDISNKVSHTSSIAIRGYETPKHSTISDVSAKTIITDPIIMKKDENKLINEKKNEHTNTDNEVKKELARSTIKSALSIMKIRESLGKEGLKVNVELEKKNDDEEMKLTNTLSKEIEKSNVKSIESDEYKSHVNLPSEKVSSRLSGAQSDLNKGIILSKSESQGVGIELNKSTSSAGSNSNATSKSADSSVHKFPVEPIMKYPQSETNDAHKKEDQISNVKAKLSPLDKGEKIDRNSSLHIKLTVPSDIEVHKSYVGANKDEKILDNGRGSTLIYTAAQQSARTNVSDKSTKSDTTASSNDITIIPPVRPPRLKPSHSMDILNDKDPILGKVDSNDLDNVKPDWNVIDLNSIADHVVTKPNDDLNTVGKPIAKVRQQRISKSPCDDARKSNNCSQTTVLPLPDSAGSLSSQENPPLNQNQSSSEYCLFSAIKIPSSGRPEENTKPLARKMEKSQSNDALNEDIFQYNVGDESPCPSRPPPIRLSSSKRKPAPPRPLPVKRQVRSNKFIPYELLYTQLKEVNDEQSLIEKKSRPIQKALNKLKEKDEGYEALFNEWLDIVEKKNTLFKKEHDLHDILKQQELEDRHTDLEYEYRILLGKQESLKTAEDKIREEELLKQIVSTVNARSKLVDDEEDSQEKLSLDGFPTKKNFIQKIMSKKTSRSGSLTSTSIPWPKSKPSKKHSKTSVFYEKK